MGDNIACEIQNQRKSLWMTLWYSVYICPLHSGLSVLMHMDRKGCYCTGCCFSDKLYMHTVHRVIEP